MKPKAPPKSLSCVRSSSGNITADVWYLCVVNFVVLNCEEENLFTATVTDCNHPSSFLYGTVRDPKPSFYSLEKKLKGKVLKGYNKVWVQH